ncbi:hypothetical protein V6N13_063795 [Hibiscus sabdariffa]|uniref:Reverse transcriptase zinc-binding domain-containing protein n=1 Tax=Hibiscus sabdariffa TaxID=183260 RepID=A0ABR2R168_9ROSI
MHLTWLAISWEEKCVSKLVGKLLQWGWCKMNTDGSRCIVTGRVSCGGVLKNAKGEWIMGFSRFINVCSRHDVEFCGVCWRILMMLGIGDFERLKWN